MMGDSRQGAGFELRRLLPDAIDYPAALHRCADAGSVPAVTMMGDPGILDRRLTGFFCSVRCPGGVILKTYDLARVLRNTDLTLIGGFQSSMEKEFLDLVLRGSASVVVCPARGVGPMRIPKDWKNPLTEGRFLVLSFFDDGIRRPTAAISAARNGYVASIADRLLIAHAERGGKTEKLCKDTLAQGKPVFTLDSPDNAHLLELGVVPIRKENLAPLVAGKHIRHLGQSPSQ